MTARLDCAGLPRDSDQPDPFSGSPHLHMAGYSSTSLWKKLGYSNGSRAFVTGAPAAYRELLALPPEVGITWLGRLERGMKFVHVFADEARSLQTQLAALRREIAPDGVVWVSWPKKASGVATDLTEDTIRSIALPMGFVDVKVCAVDATWSGLKLMIRRTER